MRPHGTDRHQWVDKLTGQSMHQDLTHITAPARHHLPKAPRLPQSFINKSICLKSHASRWRESTHTLQNYTFRQPRSKHLRFWKEFPSLGS